MLDKTSETAISNAAQPPSPANSPIIRVEKPGPWLQLLSIRSFEWTHAELPIPGLPPELDGLRLLHLSDFHARAHWEPAYDELIDRVRQNPPDLILFTGDFVDSKYDPRDQLECVTRLIKQLPSRLGFFAILGNHDGDLAGPPMAAANITLMENSRLCLTSGSATIELIGLAGVDRRDLDMRMVQSIGPKPDNAVRIVLSHYPDAIRRVAFLQPDMFLCGHTHGGQVCLPGRVPIIRHDSLPRRYSKGIHRAFGTWLVAHRGFGYSAAGMIRLFCPAEVIEIRLRRV